MTPQYSAQTSPKFTFAPKQDPKQSRPLRPSSGNQSTNRSAKNTANSSRTSLQRNEREASSKHKQRTNAQQIGG